MPPKAPTGVKKRQKSWFSKPSSVIAILVASMASLFAMSVLPENLFCAIRLLPETVFGLTDPLILLDNSTYHSSSYNSTMMWGSYRPHLYFGMRTRTKEAILTGLMWRDRKHLVDFRHTAEDGDIVHFGWLVHDGKTFGKQSIVDREIGLTMNLFMIKFPSLKNGGDWATLIEGEARLATELVYYISNENSKEPFTVVGSSDRMVRIQGEGAEAGPFHLVLTISNSIGNISMDVAGKKKTKNVWDLMKSPKFTDVLKGDENILRVRVVIPKGTFRLQASLLSGEGLETEAGGKEIKATGSLRSPINGCKLNGIINRRLRAFDQKFEKIFGLKAQGFGASEIEMAKMGMSNYLGGMGYWYGRGQRWHSPTHEGGQAEIVDMDAASLFSGVPSRSKFPRGFLWDEGFHQVLCSKWDPELSKDVILHWMNLMDKKGWIGREQILGPEPRTRVPAEFVPQTPTHANPPTMTLQIQNFALHNANGEHTHFLTSVLPYLKRWFHWFQTTQKGNVNPSFRWRGRKGYHLLPSGLDDYPRSWCPSVEEKHVDLYSWVTLMATTIQDISDAVGSTSKNNDGEHGQIFTNLSAALNDLHWDPKRKQWSDRSGCGPLDIEHNPRISKREDEFLSHFGYINLFPVLTGVAADEEKLVAVVKKCWNLMSGFGLQSLRTEDQQWIGQSDNYWTGPIWININYMMLRALKTKYNHVKGAPELYTKLRRDLIWTIGAEYKRTRKLWENYNATTGEGRGTAPFTGWTTLILLIMSEIY